MRVLLKTFGIALLVVFAALEAPVQTNENSDEYFINVTTDKYCYNVGETVKIIVDGKFILHETTYFDLLRPIILNEWNEYAVEPIRYNGPIGFAPVFFIGPKNYIWDQKYAIYDKESLDWWPPLIPPSGEYVPNGKYTIWFGYWRLGDEDWLEGYTKNLTTPAEIMIGDCSSVPVADAGPDLEVDEGDTVLLDGSRSKGGIPGGIPYYNCPGPGPPKWPLEPEEPFENIIENGGFEYGLDSWSSVGSVSISNTIVFNGSLALFANTSTSSPGYIYQEIKNPGPEYILYWWFYFVSLSDDLFVVKLVSNWDPTTGDADIITSVKIIEEDIIMSAWNIENFWSFKHLMVPNKWYKFVIAVDESAHAQCWWFPYNGSLGIISPGLTTFSPEHIIIGDTSTTDFAGDAYFDNFILLGPQPEIRTQFAILSYEWDFTSDGTYDYIETPSSAPDGAFDGKTAHIYGDNGVYTAILRITDDNNASDTDTCNVTVNNVAPSTSEISAYTQADITLRLAGEKWHDATIYLYENGTEIGTATVVRFPGSPDEQSATIEDVYLDLTKEYSAKVVYTPDDDPVNGQPNGANPAWIILTFEGGTEERIHHTFNVKHPETWEWNVMLNPHLAGHEITLESSALDPGSDDLTFDWGLGTPTIHYNDGTNPDPYPSPDGIFPFEAKDVYKCDYPGSGILTLKVSDDDGGAATAAIALA